MIKGVSEMTTAQRNHEWMPLKLFIVGIMMAVFSWIGLLVVMAIMPI
jgi:hypothetical protein